MHVFGMDGMFRNLNKSKSYRSFSHSPVCDPQSLPVGPPALPALPGGPPAPPGGPPAPPGGPPAPPGGPPAPHGEDAPAPSGGGPPAPPCRPCPPPSSPPHGGTRLPTRDPIPGWAGNILFLRII